MEPFPIANTETGPTTGRIESISGFDASPLDIVALRFFFFQLITDEQ